jgi:hypothetical protein
LRRQQAHLAGERGAVPVDGVVDDEPVADLHHVAAAESIFAPGARIPWNFFPVEVPVPCHWTATKGARATVRSSSTVKSGRAANISRKKATIASRSTASPTGTK